MFKSSRKQMLSASVAILLLAAGSNSAVVAGESKAKMRDTAAAALSVGDVAPDFSLQGADGKTYSLSGLRGERSVILVFYRGVW